MAEQNKETICQEFMQELSRQRRIRQEKLAKLREGLSNGALSDFFLHE